MTLRSWWVLPSRTRLRTALLAMQHLERGDHAAADLRDEPLGDDAGEGRGELHPDLVLALGREHVEMRSSACAASLVCSVANTR